MASRSIGDLDPGTQVLCNRHLDRCRRDTELRRRGVDVILTCTHRDDDEQNRLYAQGRTAPGRIVTNAKAGQSAHNRKTPQGKPASKAYDVALIVNGKALWADDPATPENEMELWELVGQHGVAAGLKWYGTPGARFPEKPHFQDPAP
jgi:peptidoglycan L-alanyl-D-glutamate endopeptidase CwlK